MGLLHVLRFLFSLTTARKAWHIRYYLDNVYVVLPTESPQHLLATSATLTDKSKVKMQGGEIENIA